MSVEDTIPVRDAVEAYVSATGSSPSLAEQIVAELREPGTLRLDLLGDPLPFFIKDGQPVVERARFDALMARVRQRRSQAETM
jgi:hypothetical protein